MAYNIKKLLKERELNYIKTTEQIVSGFIQPLKSAIEDVIYDGDDIEMAIKNVRPILQNLKYVSISLTTANYSLGDMIPVTDDESGAVSKTIEITDENFWTLADNIDINVPVSVLETQDETVISDFLYDVYENDGPVPLNDENNPQDIMDYDDIEEEASTYVNEMDAAKKSVYNLYKTSGSSH